MYAETAETSHSATAASSDRGSPRKRGESPAPARMHDSDSGAGRHENDGNAVREAQGERDADLERQESVGACERPAARYSERSRPGGGRVDHPDSALVYLLGHREPIAVCRQVESFEQATAVLVYRPGFVPHVCGEIEAAKGRLAHTSTTLREPDKHARFAQERLIKPDPLPDPPKPMSGEKVQESRVRLRLVGNIWDSIVCARTCGYSRLRVSNAQVPVTGPIDTGGDAMDKIDLGRAFKAPFADAEWVKKTLMGWLWMLLGVTAPAVYGAQLEYIKSVSEGREDLPDWSDFGNKWVKGFMLLIAGFIYTLPIWILFFILAAPRNHRCGRQQRQFRGRPLWRRHVPVHPVCSGLRSRRRRALLCSNGQLRPEGRVRRLLPVQ